MVNRVLVHIDANRRQQRQEARAKDLICQVHALSGGFLQGAYFSCGSVLFFLESSVEIPVRPEQLDQAREVVAARLRELAEQARQAAESLEGGAA